MADKKEVPEMELVVVSESALPEIIKAEIFQQIATAHQFPRSLKVFTDKAMSMATFSEDVAASCSYSVPRAGKAIEGASVRLAEIVVNTYGNIRAGARIIANDGKTITAQGICHDLESNTCVTVEVKRKITDRNGKTFSEDMQTVTGNAACAIAFRNAVFKVVPFAMVEPIYEAAKEVSKGTQATLVKRRTAAVEAFKKMGVTEKQLCETLEIKKIEDIDLEKLAILTGFKSAIKNNEATVKSIFESKNEIDYDEFHYQLTELFEVKKAKLNEMESNRFQQILDEKETASYEKMMSALNSL